MLTTNRDMMLRAREKGHAVGAFNVNNLETVLAVAERMLGQAKEGMKEVVREKVRLFRSSGKV